MSVTFYTPDSDSISDRCQLNLSNANARYVLDALGFADEDAYLGGECEPMDLLGRILVASGLSPVDPGRPGTRDGRVIDCGRRPGYLQEKLIELEVLARSARDAHLGKVYWA